MDDRDHEDAMTELTDAAENAPNRRILKVRLRQDQVIRLHELRILQGKSIASLLEGILEDYFARQRAARAGAGQAPTPPAGAHWEKEPWADGPRDLGGPTVPR